MFLLLLGELLPGGFLECIGESWGGCKLISGQSLIWNIHMLVLLKVHWRASWMGMIR